MQLASANASACIGEGPAIDALSRVTDTPPDFPANTRSCSQISSTTVGGLGLETGSAIRAIVTARHDRRAAACGSGGLRAVRLIAVKEARDREPRKREQNQ